MVSAKFEAIDPTGAPEAENIASPTMSAASAPYRTYRSLLTKLDSSGSRDSKRWTVNTKCAVARWVLYIEFGPYAPPLPCKIGQAI